MKFSIHVLSAFALLTHLNPTLAAPQPDGQRALANRLGIPHLPHLAARDNHEAALLYRRTDHPMGDLVGSGKKSKIQPTTSKTKATVQGAAMNVASACKAGYQKIKGACQKIAGSKGKRDIIEPNALYRRTDNHPLGDLVGSGNKSKVQATSSKTKSNVQGAALAVASACKAGYQKVKGACQKIAGKGKRDIYDDVQAASLYRRADNHPLGDLVGSGNKSKVQATSSKTKSNVQGAALAVASACKAGYQKVKGACVKIAGKGK